MIELKNNVRGFYRLEVAKVTDNGIDIPGTRKSLSEFENLITDIGINELGTRSGTSCISNTYVGVGNTPPAFTDTDMDNFLASTTSTQSTNDDAQDSVEPYYVFRQITRRFSAGSATGNLTEVGIGWSASPAGSVFSRALIQDSMGSPTTIQVQSDEVLDVTYEYRVYMNTSDAVGTTVIDSITYDYTARPALANDTTAWNISATATATNNFKGRVYSGNINDVFSLPSGTSSPQSSRTDGTYSNGSLQASGTYEWDLNSGNIGGVRSAYLGIGVSSWQVEFSAQGSGDPIPKDNTKELSLSVSHSWARGSV